MRWVRGEDDELYWICDDHEMIGNTDFGCPMCSPEEETNKYEKYKV